jgi:hypothetical protein
MPQSQQRRHTESSTQGAKVHKANQTRLSETLHRKEVEIKNLREADFIRNRELEKLYAFFKEAGIDMDDVL